MSINLNHTNDTLIPQSGNLNITGNIVLTGNYYPAITSSDTLQLVTNRGNSTTTDIAAARFLDSGNNNYYLDPANSGTSLLTAGSVGIGTSDPGAFKLYVNGSGRFGGGIDNGTNTVLSVAPGTILFDAPGVSGGRFTVKGDTGYVGVGIADPLSNLHIVNNNTAYDGVSTSSGSGFRMQNSNAGQVLLRADHSTGAPYDGDLAILTQFYDGTSYVWKECARFVSSGNVGIGNTNPLDKLHITGNLRATDDDMFNFRVQRIPIEGSPQQGLYKGYILLAYAHTGGFQPASYVIGKIIMRRGTGSTGHNIDVYEVNSSRGYSTDYFSVNITSQHSPRFVKLVKCTYNGVVYHAIETTSTGGQPSTEMFFEGAILNAVIKMTDSQYVSSVSAYGNVGFTVSEVSNFGIGTTTPQELLHVIGTGTASGTGSHVARFTRANGAGVFLGYNSDFSGGAIWGANNLTFRTYNGTSWIEAGRFLDAGNFGVGTDNPGQIIEASKAQNADTVIQVTNNNTGGSATAQFFANNGTNKTQFFHTGTSYSGAGILESAPSMGGIYNTTAQGIALISANDSGAIKFAVGAGNQQRASLTSTAFNITVATSIDSPDAWNAATPMLNVGGTGDGRLQVRHIWGKQSGSASSDHLWLNYQNGAKHVQIGDSGGGNNLYVSGTIYVGGYFSGNQVWHAGNDGSSSGLDADTVDGYESTVLMGASDRKVWTNLGPDGANAYRHTIGRLYFTPNHWTSSWQNIRIKIYNDYHNSGYAEYQIIAYYGMGNGNGCLFLLKDAEGADLDKIKLSLGTVTYAGWQYAGENTYYQDIYVDATYYTTAAVIATTFGHSYQTVNPTSGTDGCFTVFYTTPNVATNSSYSSASYASTYHLGEKIWNAGNDGSGSGLDADTLDGIHASGFTLQAVATNGNTYTGDIDAARFRDYSNTAYYLDPSNTGTSLLTAGNVLLGTTTQVGRLRTVGGATLSNFHSNLFVLSEFVASDNYLAETGITLGYNSVSGSSVIMGGNPYSYTGLELWTKSTKNAVSITYDGKVGIGTGTPWGALQISKSVNNSSAIATNITNFSGSVVVIHNQDDAGTGNKTGLFFAHAGSPGLLSGIASTKDASSWQTNLDFYVNNVTGGADTGIIQHAVRIKSNGNVGIAVAAPEAKLHVNGTASDGQELIRITSDANLNNSGYHWMSSMMAGNEANAHIISLIGKAESSKNSGYFGFRYQGNSSNDNFITLGGYAADNLMVIKMNGNVGIGTTSPEYRLEAYDTDGSGDRTVPKNVLAISAANPSAPYNGFGAGLVFKSADYTNYPSPRVQARIRNVISNDSVNSTGSGIAFDVTPTPGASLTEAMRLTHASMLGIGTSSPIYKLHVTGDIYANGGWLRVSGNQGLYFETWGGGWYMTDSNWIRTYNSKNVWTDTGILGTGSGGVSSGYGGTSPPSGGAIISGNTGIGTQTPQYKLDVYQSGIAASFGATIGSGQIAGIHFGYSEATNTAYRKSALVFERTDNNNQGGNASGKIHFLLMNASNSSATSLAHSVVTIDSDANGTVGSVRMGVGTTTPTYTLQVNGSFAATTKSFVIDHPTKPGKKLRHGSLEGPENGVYIRGRLNSDLSGSKKIELPEYWSKLVDPDSITVTLTPVGKKQTLYVSDISFEDLTIEVAGATSIDCFFMVFAERIDVEKLQVEVE